MAAINFYNTFLTYGLASEEREFFIENEANFAEFKKFVDKDLVELNWIDCKEFTDVLAIPAFMILIDFLELDEDEFEAFNESFKSSEALIISLRNTPDNGDFVYYSNFDLIHNDLDKLQLLRTMMIMKKRNYMLSSDDIKISINESYIAVDMSFKNDEIIYEAVRIFNGKIQMDTPMQTTNLTELKEWIGETPVIVWQREMSRNKKSYNKLNISNKLIDLYLFSASEFPVLSFFQEIDDRLKYFFSDCNETNNCMKIAYLFLIVLLRTKNENIPAS